MKNNNFKSLSFKELKETNGGCLEPIGWAIGACAGLLYAYEWGYNYAYKRTH
jgi:lactobin A/cerein 7B family class IIb bacteriocin